MSEDGSPCPDCGTFTLYADAPKAAPDFICSTCHGLRCSDDTEWAIETAQRRHSLVCREVEKQVKLWVEACDTEELQDLLTHLGGEIIA